MIDKPEVVKRMEILLGQWVDSFAPHLEGGVSDELVNATMELLAEVSEYDFE